MEVIKKLGEFKVSELQVNNIETTANSQHTANSLETLDPRPFAFSLTVRFSYSQNASSNLDALLATGGDGRVIIVVVVFVVIASGPHADRRCCRCYATGIVLL